MSVALRTITRLQDADDINVNLGAGVDEYALCWDNDTARFVLRAVTGGVTDHGALTGLTPDDDHTQYALLAGRTGGQTLYGGTAANDDITIHGTSDATRTTSYVLLQPTAGNVGIGTSAPDYPLHIKSNSYQLQLQSFTGTALIGMSSAGPLLLSRTGNSTDFNIDTTGLVGIGTTAPATPLHVTSTTATTNALRNVLTLGANVTSTGVGAAGLGPAILFTAESSTTADTTQARIAALWNDHTHSQFKSDLVGYASDAAAEREIWRGRANGSAPAIGFLGATPQARIAHVVDPAGGATVDAEARSAINSILSTLELFGFHAAS